MCGEHGAVNGTTNPYSIEVKSERAVVYKIHRDALKLIGQHSDAIEYLRAHIQMKTNWVAFKTQDVANLEPEEQKELKFKGSKKTNKSTNTGS